MWIDPKTGKVALTHSDIRLMRPNWSAGAVLKDEDILEQGFLPVQQKQPSFNPETHKLVKGLLKESKTGWVQEYRAVALTDDELKAKVPQKVTRRQARQALLLEGLLDKVEPAIAQIPDATQRGLAQIEWEDSLEFERNRPLVIQIGTILGLDDAGLDALFTKASKL